MSEVEKALARSGVPAASLAALTRYGELLLEATQRTNLTAARTPEALAEHIVDALSLAPYVRGPLVDVGAGGGLPGIPLAIACNVPVTLIDATAKKVAFLARALSALEVDGQAVCGRAERLAHDPAFREQFAHATARAVAGGSTVLELTLPFLRIGGTALLQRGALAEPERQAIAGAALVLGGEVTEEISAGGERRIIVVAKRSPTARRFPRRNGVPAKRPLCS
ncbi:MAG: 16S rRNA (guanine(527)-N(7))-methyltransferase RsmG [Candidatus Eremiobacteraeota bacterium]|nr:16S rRNA (guanine(527)-N(7))-methyltransferase RsmG [Candidatus Eremiobacteraeota bacterium]